MNINEMTMIELAEHAVTLPGWEWMGGCFDWRSRIRVPYVLPKAPIPDLNDPATLGCVLAMARKKRAYLVIECRLISDMPNEPNSRPYYRAVSPFGSESWMVHTDWMQTEAHALIAVLALEE